jgi:hypothetical protein
MLIVSGKKFLSIYDYEMETLSRTQSSDNIISILFQKNWMANENFKIIETKEVESSYILQVTYSEDSQKAELSFNKKSLDLAQIKIFEMDEPSIVIDFDSPVRVKNFKRELFEVRAPEIFGKPKHHRKKDIEKLFIGQKIVAYNNASPNKKYICEIILISKDISDERTVEVHCHFDKYDKSLIPGMYMNGEVKVSTNKAFVINNEGIVRFEGKQYIFEALKSNKYKMLEVTTQNNENGFTQINLQDTSYIADKTFVTSGAYPLLMKMKNTE